MNCEFKIINITGKEEEKKTQIKTRIKINIKEIKIYISVICRRFCRSNYESVKWNNGRKENGEVKWERVWCVLEKKMKKRCTRICVTRETVRERKRKRVRCEGDETKKGTRRATKSGWPPDTRAKTKIRFWT